MVKYKSIVKNLQKKYSDAAKVVVVSTSGKIIYTTDNWNVKSDIKGVLASWASGNAQFVNIDGVRYSVLQMEPERFIATNRKKKGHLVGAATPDMDRYVIAHIKPKAKGWFHMAYPTVARAAAMMKSDAKLKSFEPEIEISSGGSRERAESDVIPRERGSVVSIMKEQPYIDPYLKSEIEGFLQWIKNPQGLQGYISYHIKQNDQYIISKLAEIYEELYRICKA
ncbi:MAG: hypothetical protein ACFFAN_14330 [Promethearchaeota archaeon]